MYCANCGKELGGGKFCPNCGTAVQSKAVEQKPNETKTSVDNREGKVSEGKNITLSLPSKVALSKMSIQRVISFVYLLLMPILIFLKIISIEISSETYSVGYLDFLSKKAFKIYDKLDYFVDLEYMSSLQLYVLLIVIIMILAIIIIANSINGIKGLVNDKTYNISVAYGVLPLIYSSLIIITLWYIDIRISVELSQNGFITEYFSSYFSIKAATPIWIMLTLSIVMIFLANVIKTEKIDVSIKQKKVEPWTCPSCGLFNEKYDYCERCNTRNSKTMSLNKSEKV